MIVLDHVVDLAGRVVVEVADRDRKSVQIGLCEKWGLGHFVTLPGVQHSLT